MYQKQRLQLHQLRPGPLPIYTRAHNQQSATNEIGQNFNSQFVWQRENPDWAPSLLSVAFVAVGNEYSCAAIFSLVFIAAVCRLHGSTRLHGICVRWNGHRIMKNLISFRLFSSVFYFWNCARGRGDNGQRHAAVETLLCELVCRLDRSTIETCLITQCTCCLCWMLLFRCAGLIWFHFFSFLLRFFALICRPSRETNQILLIRLLLCLRFRARACPMWIIVNSIHLVPHIVPSHSHKHIHVKRLDRNLNRDSSDDVT